MQKQLMKSADYFLSVRELQELAGARLDHVYDAPAGFRLRFRKQGNEYNVIAEPGCRLHWTRLVPRAPASQSSFVQLLRKELENARVEEVKQINFDRIVAFTFFSRGSERTLVFEQFGKGNVFLLAEIGLVMRPLRSLELGGRQLRKGDAYAPPQQSKAAGKFAAEIAALEGKRLQPTVYFENTSAAAFSAFEDGVKNAVVFSVKKTFPTFSEALDDYYAHCVAKSPQASELEKQVAKLRHALEQQKKRLAELEREEAGAKRGGELIYENYALVENELEKARKKGEKTLELGL